MPVVAVAGVIGGATALATGALTVMQTIAAIGSIVGGIGSLTGNKTLAKIGAVAGLAGGIGAFAESQGWLASASAAETASNAANASAIEMMKAAPSGAEFNVAVDPSTAVVADSAAAGTAAELGAMDMAQPMQQATQGLDGANSISNTIGQANPDAAAAMGGAPAARGTGLMDAAAPGSPAADLVPSPSGEVAAGLNPTDMRLEAGTQGSPMASVADQLTASAKAGGSKVLDLFKEFFTGKDGKVDKGMLSLAGNFVGGMFDGEKAAREELYKTRAENERQQMANASAVPDMNFRSKPNPGGTFRSTSPTYRPVRIAPGGLMNAR